MLLRFDLLVMNVPASGLKSRGKPTGLRAGVVRRPSAWMDRWMPIPLRVVDR